MENANSSPARTRVSWRVWAVYGIVMTLFAVTATSIAGESYLRYREQHRATFDGIMPTLFYRHSRLGHALVRDFEYFGRIHIDREGFRGPEVALAKAPGVTRIMVVGSSTTFDPGVSHDSLAWPARLKGEMP